MFAAELHHTLATARTEAHRLHHASVRTEHLALGLLRAASPPLSALLAMTDVAELAAAIEQHAYPGAVTDIDPYDVSYTQPAKDVIERAMREARRRGDGVVGSADLLVGVLQVVEGLRREVFGARGLTVDHVRGALDSARSEGATERRLVQSAGLRWRRAGPPLYDRDSTRRPRRRTYGRRPLHSLTSAGLGRQVYRQVNRTI